jgi:hypothetical protein
MCVESEMIIEVVMTHFEVLPCKTSCRITGDLSQDLKRMHLEQKPVIDALTC